MLLKARHIAKTLAQEKSVTTKRTTESVFNRLIVLVKNCEISIVLCIEVTFSLKQMVLKKWSGGEIVEQVAKKWSP